LAIAIGKIGAWFERDALPGPFLCLARKKLEAATMENGDPGFTTAMHKRHWSNSPPTTMFPVRSGRALALRSPLVRFAPHRGVRRLQLAPRFSRLTSDTACRVM
jgi:hypothetical protein